MLNLKSFEDFVESEIHHYYNFSTTLNESVVIKDFYTDVFEKIAKVTNEKVLVVNSPSFAEMMYNESSDNNIVCIYFDSHFEIPSESKVNYKYVNFYMNDKEISADTQNSINEIYGEFSEIDKMFIFSLPIGNGLRGEDIAKLNYVIFKKWHTPGITTWYSFDEVDTQESFSKIVYDSDKYKINLIGEIPSDVWSSSKFEGDEDRYINHIFIRENSIMGAVSAEDLDKEDMVNKYTDISDGILKHYIEPRIYAFRTNLVDNVIAPRTALKVGDTDRGVGVRLNEWGEVFPDYEYVDDWPAVVHGCGDGLDGKVFRDYTIHKILKGKGWNKEKVERDDFGKDNLENNRYSNEFFYDTTSEDVERAINHLHNLIKKSRYDIISKLKDDKKKKRTYIDPSHDKHIKFKERELQTRTIDKFEERYVEGDREMLMYAVMRFGKTYTACRCAQELAGKFTVVVSAKADVKGEWLGAVNPYEEFRGYNMYLASGDGSLYNMLKGIGKKKKGKKKSIETTDTVKTYENLDEYLEKNPNDHVMLFLTLQDLNRYVNGTKSKEGKEYYNCFIKTPVDLLIIDEAHYGPQGKEYGKGIGEGWDKEEKDEGDEEFTSEETAKLINSLNLNGTTKLHLSGTPYDLVARGKFNLESIIAKFGFEDLMDEKQKWIDNNAEKIKKGEVSLDQNPYFGIPNMIQFGYQFTDFDISRIMKDGDVNFINLFKAVKDKETGTYKFKYETEILNMLRAIDGSDPDAKKNGIMAILNSPSFKKEKMCKHIVMVLPRTRTCDLMEDLLTEHKKELTNLGEYKIVNIASERAGISTDDAKDIIRDEDAAGNKTISLTVIQMLTGVSVREWDTMLYMKDGSGPQSYDQARFRIQTPYIGEREVLDVNDDGDGVKPVKNADGKNVTIKIDKKPQTLFVDFSIDRCYKILYDRLHTEARREVNSEEEVFEVMEEKLKRYKKYMPILVNNMNHLQEEEIENVMRKIFQAYANENMKGNTFDQKLDSIDWTSQIDFAHVDYGFMNRFEDSYTTGGDKTPSIEGHMMIGGTPVEIENPEVAEEDKKMEEEFAKESEEDDIPEIDDDIPEDDSDIPEEEPGDSEPELDLDDSDGIDYDNARKEEIKAKCNAIMKNIMIYMLCRNDNVKVFKNFHDLVWDSMRSPANYDVILNIFDQKHSDEPDIRKKAAYVQRIRKDIMLWHNHILKPNEGALKQALAMIVGACLTKSERNNFNMIKDTLQEFGKGAIGKTEFITPGEICEKLLTSDNVVIFNKDSKILDCYGSKTGEILHYIIEKCPDYNVDNYYVICKNGWVAELNKVVMKLILANQGRKFSTMEELAEYLDEHILICDLNIVGELKNKIENKWGDMAYDCIIGNPPYSKNLHLKIIDSVLGNLKKDGVGIFIHPCKWITDPYHNYYNDSIQNNFLNKYVKHIKALEEIDTETFNRIFKTQNRFGVGIVTYTTKDEDIYDQHSFESELDSIMGKILKYTKKSFRSQFIKKGSETTDFFTPVRRTNHGYLEWCGGDATEGIQFNTQKELDNFIKSTFKWPYVWLNKYGNENSADMPFLGDYKNEWTDDMLFDYFHIDDDEKKKITNSLKDKSGEILMKKSKKKSTHISSSSTKPKSEEEQGQEDADLQSYLLDRDSKKVKEG